MAPIVYSTHALHPRAEAMVRAVAELRIASALDAGTLAREAEPATIVVVRAPLPTVLFERAKDLRAAIRHGAGVDMIPIEAADAAGVLVANVPGANARSVAEYVLFAALVLTRRFRTIDRDLRGQGWLAGRAHAESAGELFGRTLGLVGFGAVGRATAAIAGAFGLRVIVATRRPDTALPAGVEARALDALMAESDILALCCPLTAETRGLIDARRLGLMRRSAVLVNVARGPVADEAALVEALQAGRIAGAALDVFATQPLPPDHPFFRLDTVMLTPHLAGITGESMERMGVGVAEEVERILAGGLPLNFVNPGVAEAYRKRFP